MKKNYISKITSCLMAFAVFTGCFTLAPVNVKQAKAATSRQVENLDRGLTAVKTSGGVHLSWRFLGTDSSSTGFDVYRDGKKITSSLITNSTNYIDKGGNTSSTYYVTAVNNNRTIDTSKKVSVLSNNYLDVPISKPNPGTTPDGKTYTYTAGDSSVADLDGDGEYEIILKWDPSNAQDNSKNGYTGNVILDAYKLNGTRLWRIDLGKNIRAGAHYTQFMVYDYDGDGCAEMVCKTADGTRDGKGSYIGNKSADFRGSDGRILSGPEYLTLFDGKTGANLNTVNYEPARGNVSSWGDKYGNRCDRFLGAVAYLNGKTPSVVMCRGYYTRSVLAAYDVVNKKLVKRWVFDSNSSGNSAYAGQGNHNLAVADVDGDGFDEIVYGACTIDHNGKGLYSSKLGHGDAIHVGDFLPNRPGLEIWSCFESGQYGAALRDAKTGQILLRKTASGDTGRCIAGNFIPGNSGAEFYSTANPDLFDGSGKSVGSWSNITKWGANFTVYWDGDLEQEALDRTMIDKYNKGRLFTAPGVVAINSTKSTPSLCADILGDWREEVIWPTSDSSALRIFMTTDSTNYRIATLMHDTQYRCQVASQNVGYNQPAHTSFFLGTGFNLPAKPNVYTTKSSNPAQKAGLEDGWYYIKNVHAQKYLQVLDNLGKAGQNVELATGTGAQGQRWYLTNLDNGYVTLKSGVGDFMLDVTGNKNNDGANIEIYNAHSGTAEQFMLTSPTDSNTFVIATKTSNCTKALDDYNYSTREGANVCQWTCGGNDNQLWAFEKIN